MKNVKFNFPSGKSSFILEAKQAVSSEVCESLISECTKYYDKLFSPGPTLGGINTYIKSSMDFSFSGYQADSAGIGSHNFYQYEKIIADALFGCLAFYQKTFNEL